MSGVPRAGLFARNYAATLVNRNRALQAANAAVTASGTAYGTANGTANGNANADAEQNTLMERSCEEGSKQTTSLSDDIPSMSIQDENREGETETKALGAAGALNPTPTPTPGRKGPEDVDAYFAQAGSHTPSKTPRSNLRRTLRNAGKALAGSVNVHQSNESLDFSFSAPVETESTAAQNTLQLQPQQLLIAKPVAIIPSKIAAHYRKEPRLAVAMSAVEQEISYSQAQAQLEVAQPEEPMEHPATPVNQIDLEEMTSVGADGFQEYEEPLNAMDEGDGGEDVVEKFVNLGSMENDTEVHLSATIRQHQHQHQHQQNKPSLTLSVQEGNDSGASVFNDFGADDDRTMDRLAEELLVQEEPNPVAEAKTRAPKKNTRRTVPIQRRPPSYFPGTDVDESGVRKGKRVKLTPLKYWANEKVCYGRAADPAIRLPVIVNVIKKPELDDPTFGSKPSARRNGAAAKAAAASRRLKGMGFGPAVDVEAAVNDYATGVEEDRLLALSHHHVHGEAVKDCGFRIQTIFTEGKYMSAGQLLFPAGAQKPTKNSARHALVFYVISGSFRIEIHRTSFVIGPGGQFHVPRANHYTITHISEDSSVEGRLFFCHCKDNAANAEG